MDSSRGKVTNQCDFVYKITGLNAKQRASRDRLKTRVRDTSNGQLVPSETEQEGTWRDVGEDEDDIDLDELGIDATQNDLENEHESNFDGDDEHDDDEDDDSVEFFGENVAERPNAEDWSFLKVQQPR